MANSEISTYYQYRHALTEYIKKNGNEMLSERQMQQFISLHDLECRFGITVSEVQIDAHEIAKRIPAVQHPEYILALKTELLPKASFGLADCEIDKFIRDHGYRLKYNLRVDDVRIHLAKLVNGTWIPIKASLSKAFQSDKAYQAALRNKVQPNSKEPLSETSIRVLIKRGGFDKSCGLDIETVKQDMYALPNGFNVQILRSTHSHSSPNPLIPSSKASSAVNLNVTAKSNSFSLDDHLYSAISTALCAHVELIQDRRRLSGLFKDVCPTHRREVNILLQIYDLGIVAELQHQSIINQLFIQRFTNRLVNEYGTSESLAMSLVTLWCLCYGRDICHIACDL